MGKILVADDNPLSLQFFSEAIAVSRHESIAVSDGVAARDAAMNQPFDLIVLDARMPGLDGLQALAEIRAGNGPNRSTPALVTTAETSADRNAMRDLGFLDILYKPIGLAALHAALARHLPGLADHFQARKLLDDALAIEKIGGDASIIAALRGLFAGELDALPDELDCYAETTDRELGVVAGLHGLGEHVRGGVAQDREALLDRLHRLDASAGFCGAVVLSQAIAVLRNQMDTDASWPHSALTILLMACMDTRRALD